MISLWRWPAGSMRKDKAPPPGVASAEDRDLVVNSGLFDPAWYLAHNPEVAEAGLDPVDHYILVGGHAGRSAGPDFDDAWYLAAYPDIGQAGAHPLLHYLRFGRQEGREPKLSPLAAVAAQVLSEVSRFDPDLMASGLLDRVNRLPLSRGVGRGRLMAAWVDLFRSLERPYGYLVFAPGPTGGDVLTAAREALRSTIERHGPAPTLLVATEGDWAGGAEPPPDGVDLRVLSRIDPGLTGPERTQLVEMLVMALLPRAVLTLDSAACWDAIRQRGRALATMTELYAMVLSRDGAVETAARLRSCLENLRQVYLDDAALAAQIIEALGLPRSLQDRIAVLGEPSAWTSGVRGATGRAS